MVILACHPIVALIPDTLLRRLSAYHPLTSESASPESGSRIRSAPRCASPYPGETVDGISPRRDIMKTWFAAVAAFITFGLALAACGSSAHPAARSPGPAQDAARRAGGGGGWRGLP